MVFHRSCADVCRMSTILIRLCYKYTRICQQGSWRGVSPCYAPWWWIKGKGNAVIISWPPCQCFSFWSFTAKQWHNFMILFWVTIRMGLWALVFRKLICSTVSSLCFSSCIFKACPPLISQLTHAWASTAHCVSDRLCCVLASLLQRMLQMYDTVTFCEVWKSQN